MLPLGALLIIAGVACILFGAWLALNLGGSAERRAAHHRVVGNPRPRWPRRNQGSAACLAAAWHPRTPRRLHVAL